VFYTVYIYIYIYICVCASRVLFFSTEPTTTKKVDDNMLSNCRSRLLRRQCRQHFFRFLFTVNRNRTTPITDFLKNMVNYESTSFDGDSDIAFPSPPDPNTCCGSGCQNCVWIMYTETIEQYVRKQGAPMRTREELDRLKSRIVAEMESQVSDLSMRAFLSMEIRSLLGRLSEQHLDYYKC